MRPGAEIPIIHPRAREIFPSGGVEPVGLGSRLAPRRCKFPGNTSVRARARISLPFSYFLYFSSLFFLFYPLFPSLSPPPLSLSLSLSVSLFFFPRRAARLAASSFFNFRYRAIQCARARARATDPPRIYFRRRARIVSKPSVSRDCRRHKSSRRDSRRHEPLSEILLSAVHLIPSLLKMLPLARTSRREYHRRRRRIVITYQAQLCAPRVPINGNEEREPEHLLRRTRRECAHSRRYTSSPLLRRYCTHDPRAHVHRRFTHVVRHEGRVAAGARSRARRSFTRVRVSACVRTPRSEFRK